MNLSVLNEADIRYASLQVAVGQFGDSLSGLTAPEKLQVEKVARAQVAIQSKVLSSTEAASVVVSDTQIEAEINTIQSRFASHTEFLQALEKFNLDETSFMRSVARNLRVDATMDVVASRAEAVTETDAKLYYYMNPDKFYRPETRVASHILITINPDYPENERSAALKRAEQVSVRLQKKPKRFAEQAMKYSECPTAMNGGSLGTLKKGTLFPSVDDVLFSLKEGFVSGVIESPMGFHIVHCERINTEGPVPLAEALPTIQDKLTERNRKVCQRSWIKSL